MGLSKNHKIAVLVIAAMAMFFLVSLPVSADSLPAWNSMTSGTTDDLYAIWGVDGSDVFAVGSSGTVMRYNGTAWTAMTSGTKNDLACVWGIGGSNVFAAGKSGTIIRYNGTAWNSMTSGTTDDLYAIWGVDGSDVFAVGSSGTVMRYNGTAWTAMISGTTDDLYAIWGTDASNVFAAGKSGTIIRYNGTAWTAMTSGTTDDLYAIWGADTSNLFAVGSSGTIIRYNGTAWTAMTSGTTGDLYAIWGANSSNVFVVGKSGVIAFYDGTKFTPMNRSNITDLRTIWGLSSADVFAAGMSGTILRYLPPFINSVSPDQGYQGSKLDVIITGKNLSAASEVRFGPGIAVNSFTILSGNQITANIEIIAGAKTGTRDVSVTTPGGIFTLVNGLKVNLALPVLASISPNQDRQGATLNTTITGTNLTAASEVRFGPGIAVNSFTILSGNQITANITIAADATVGTRDIFVTTPGGSFTLPASFTVKQGFPVLASISPNQDRQGATLNTTITGTNLTAASEVRFGPGIAVNSFTILSGNQITANITVAADATVGTRDISVTTPGGSFTLPASFTVKQGFPVLASISPNQDRQGATLNTTITGTNLTAASEVRFGPGIAVNSFTILSGNQITANITIAADATVGTRDISVTTPGGSFTLPVSFTVKQALPVIAAVNPIEGNREKTFDVTITGKNLTAASEVRFGPGIAVNSFTILSGNQITANITVAADATVGTRDISVTTPGGSFTLPVSFTVKQGMPKITSISPDNGNQGATLTITINGINLNGASEMRFGTGIAVNNMSIINSSQIEAVITIISGTETGAKDVSVTTPGGSDVLVNGFMVIQSLPVITSISPENASQGTSLAIIINGSNLEGASSVSFGTGIAVTSFTNLSPTQLLVNVVIYSDAVTGPRDISVTTPGGSSTLSNRFNIKEQALSTLILALIWLGIAAAGTLFLFILNKLRRKRAASF